MAERFIHSPLPGIFYRRPNPQADPYVVEGQRVKAGDTVGLVEVMKSFHEVNAESDGVIVQFLIENEGPVQVGQPIAKLSD